MQSQLEHPRRTPVEAFKDVVFALMLREGHSRLNGRWSSLFWLGAEPLAHMVLMLLIFGGLGDRVVPGISLVSWLVWGLLPFFVFKALALKLMEAVEVNRALFVYRPVQPIDAVVARGVLETLLAVAIYGLLLVAMLWIGLPVWPEAFLETLLLGFVFLGMGFSWGLLFAVLTTGYEKVRLFIRLSFFPLYILSGVIFPLASLPADLRGWLMLNPLAHLLEAIRGAAVAGYAPVPELNLAYPAAYVLASLAAGLLIYRLRRSTILAVRS
jgi:capsular polysaccharide transport system permease protein